MTSGAARAGRLIGTAALLAWVVRRAFVPLLTRMTGTWIGTPRP